MGRVNTWLQTRAAGAAQVSPEQVLPFIVEAESTLALPDVRQGLLSLGLEPQTRTVGPFLRVQAPFGLLADIANLTGVRTVSYDAPVWIRQAPSIVDPLLGPINLSPETIPANAIFGLGLTPLKVPLLIPAAIGQGAALLGLPGPLGTAGLPQILAPNLVIYPTGETRQWIEAPEDNHIDIPVAVLDTGCSWPHPLLPFLPPPQLYSTTGEPPWDLLGHGQWCVTAAFGGRFNTRFGECRGVAQANPAKLISVKGLSNVGFGTSFGVMWAMELAIQQGARVVSMSLGGELQGSVTEDPQCRFIQLNQEGPDPAIFVIAAGNSGPDPWTVGSPGASPFAVTVGAWSTHYDTLGIFSSRGPSGGFYLQNPTIWQTDLAAFGDDLLKPDLTAPGGGPGSVYVSAPGAIPTPVDLAAGDLQDQIYSGVTGWMDGINDLTPGDLFDAMRGTSMACPAAAGLIAWCVDRGILSGEAEVKARMAATLSDDPSLKWGWTGGKDPRVGYGLITRSRLGG